MPQKPTSNSAYDLSAFGTRTVEPKQNYDLSAFGGTRVVEPTPRPSVGRAIPSLGGVLASGVRFTGIPFGPELSPEDYKRFGQLSKRQLKEFAVNELLPNLGIGVGGAVGTVAEPGGGTILGSYLGGAAGEAGTQILQHMFPHLATGSGAPTTTDEAGRRMGNNAMLGGAMAAIPEVGTGALRALRPLRSQALIEAAESARMPYLASQVARRGANLPTMAGQTVEGSFAAQNFYRQQAAALEREAGRMATVIGPTKAEADTMVKPIYQQIEKDLEAKNVTMMVQQAQKYASQSGSLQGTLTVRQGIPVEYMASPVSTTGIKQSLLDEFKTFLNVVQKKGLPGGETSKAAQLLQTVENWPKRWNFTEAHQIRSDILDVIRENPDVFKGKANAVGTSVADKLTGAMDTAAKTYSGKGGVPDFYPAFQKAQGVWKAANIRANFEEMLTSNVIQASPEQGGQVYLNPTKMSKFWGGLSPEAQARYVPPAVQQDFGNFLRAGKVAGNSATSATGGFLANIGKDAAVRILQSPAALRLLTRGWQMQAGTREAVQLLTATVVVSSARQQPQVKQLVQQIKGAVSRKEDLGSSQSPNP